VNTVDQHAQLGAYALGALDADEAADFERRHLQDCAQCRFELNEIIALREALDEVPPEAFLDGPPEGGDLLLQRTLRQVRAEEEKLQPSMRPARRPRRGLAVVAAAVVALAALGGGVVVGRQTATTPVAQGPMQPGTRQVTGQDSATGVTMTAAVQPFNGWVRVNASVQGVHAGEKCELRVNTKDGQSVVLGSWQVSPAWEANGFNIEGNNLVPPDQVKSIDIVTVDGRKLVSAPV